jgi:hypothetical protein
MKLLFRAARPELLPRRLAQPALGAALLACAFGAQAQQWTRGEQVWTNATCAGCHTSGTVALSAMQARFTTVAAARAAADNAAMRTGSMAVYANLGSAQKDDVSAFVANFRAEANAVVTTGNVTMTVAALGQSAQSTLTLFNNGRAPLRVAMNGGQTVTGDTTQFRIQNVGNGCDTQTINPGQTCAVTIVYQPSVAPASQHSYTVTFAHNGEPTATSRVVFTGRVSGAPAPAPAPGPNPPAPAPAGDSGGGGALPLALWTALLPLALLARRRMR